MDDIKIQTARLVRLRHVAEMVKQHHLPFQMDDWIDRYACGTACCIGGWACLELEFQAQGLHLEDANDKPILTIKAFQRRASDRDIGSGIGPIYQDHSGYDALIRFFGEDAYDIFRPTSYTGFVFGRPITIDMVIAKIDEVLEGRGEDVAQA